VRCAHPANNTNGIEETECIAINSAVCGNYGLTGAPPRGHNDQRPPSAREYSVNQRQPYAGATRDGKAHPMLDSLLVVETPEGVALSLRLAGLVPRSMAFILDILIRLAICYALIQVLGTLGQSGIGLFLLLIFLLEWFYPVLFEVYGDGSTPGKRAMGIMVVESSGLPVGFQASLVRNLLRTADFLPFGYGLGLLSMLKTRHYQRLGDLAAATVVVWRQAPRPYSELPAAPPLAPALRLSLDEQLSLITFVERLPQLSPQRQLELADLLQPLSGARGQAGLQRLIGMANYLAGRR